MSEPGSAENPSLNAISEQGAPFRSPKHDGRLARFAVVCEPRLHRRGERDGAGFRERLSDVSDFITPS